MSYVDEVINQVVKQNPAEPEFHQAVKLSDVLGKNTGNLKEIEICKMTLGLD